MTSASKKYSTIGCCGIDCGLCPRVYVKGDSACPGCCGLNFRDKHPSCGFVTCCVVKKGYEVCSDCNEYPCKKFDAEKEGYDSFVTHKKVFSNLNFVKEKGIDAFIDQQRIRIDILNYLLTHFDDGRSKNFFCLSSALLPLETLVEIKNSLARIEGSFDMSEKNRFVKLKLQSAADSLKIELRLVKGSLKKQ